MNKRLPPYGHPLIIPAIPYVMVGVQELDINPVTLAMVCLEDRDAFEYLALQLEIGSGSEFLKEPIGHYRHKARQAEDLCQHIVSLIKLEGGAL